MEITVRAVHGKAHTLALAAPPLPVETQVVEWGPPAEDGMAVLPQASYVLQEDAAIYAGTATYPRPDRASSP